MEPDTPAPQPTVIPRPGHTISRADISAAALKVLYRLRESGFRACLVGGGVRDLLLGRKPKDFDIATDAHPEQVYNLFRNGRLIGRRFRLVHVQFGKEIIEVATFRGDSMPGDTDKPSSVKLSREGRIIRDNVYGNIEDDAWRRDFTINALYYDINNFAVLDYVGGMADLEAGLIRLIGDPEQRYREDPVRMLRAVRFAARLGFRIDPATETPLYHLGYLLANIPPARLLDEVIKLFAGGYALPIFERLHHYRLFDYLFPETARCLHDQQQPCTEGLLYQALANTDQRVAVHKAIHPSFLFAALLWEPLYAQWQRLLAERLSDYDALQVAADLVIQIQARHVALPRRYSLPMREIWTMQLRLTFITGKRPLRLLDHPRFRAGYDFLLLRAQTDEQAAELAHWWTQFLELDHEARTRTLIPPTKTKRKPRHRRKPRNRSHIKAPPPLSQS